MTTIYAGTSGFAHKEWKGKFYPEKISPKDMLRFYSGRLNSVEINNTFYHMPTKGVLAAWAEQVPGEFVFALKAPQVITHIKQLRNVFEEMERLFQALSVLDRKLGPVLFQFPKSSRANVPALEDFFGLLPAGRACAFEFRSPTWFEAGVADLLREKGAGLCIADTDEAQAKDIISTATWGYLRLRRSDYADSDLRQWAGMILAQKWDRAFVFFKHDGDGKGPELAMRFQDLVEGLTGGKRKTGNG
jgi:uncharacterized protein YecE (DUF72 family)